VVVPTGKANQVAVGASRTTASVCLHAAVMGIVKAIATMVNDIALV